MPVVVVGEVAIGLSPPPLLPPVPAAASGRSLGAAAGASASSAISLLRERVEERAKERRSSRERESKAIGTLQLEELWSEEEGDLAIRRSRLIQIQSEKKKERRNHGLHPPLPLRLRLVQARARRGRSSSRSRRGGLRHLALGDKRQLQGRGRQEARPELVPPFTLASKEKLTHDTYKLVFHHDDRVTYAEALPPASCLLARLPTGKLKEDGTPSFYMRE